MLQNSSLISSLDLFFFRRKFSRNPINEWWLMLHSSSFSVLLKSLCLPSNILGFNLYYIDMGGLIKSSG